MRFTVWTRKHTGEGDKAFGYKADSKYAPPVEKLADSAT